MSQLTCILHILVLTADSTTIAGIGSSPAEVVGTLDGDLASSEERVGVDVALADEQLLVRALVLAVGAGERALVTEGHRRPYPRLGADRVVLH